MKNNKKNKMNIKKKKRKNPVIRQVELGIFSK